MKSSLHTIEHLGRFRRILIRRFPYALHFELLSNRRVSVLACLHHRRDPAKWPGCQETKSQA